MKTRTSFCFILPIIFVFPGSVLSQYNYFQLEKLPDNINSPYSEITPVPSRDGRTLYFTRVGHPDFNKTLLIDSVEMSVKLADREYSSLLSDVYSQISGKKVFNPVLSAFNQDIWIARADSFDFTRTEHPEYPLNNALPNSLVTMTPDPNSFYVINQFQRNGNMDRGFSRVSKTQDSIGWGFPVPVEIADYYTITSDVSLTMSFDGEILILSAARFDSRDMDLYVCFREGPNKWSSPRHLGNVINSAYRETTPYLSEDNSTLYFSSNRLNGLGGNDIYTTQRLDSTWRKWSPPVLVGEPINSKYDESQPYFNMTSGYLYFCSRRDGNSDIFRVRIAPPQATEYDVIGRVVNRSTNELVPGAIITYNMERGVQNQIIASDGTFRIKIPKGVKTTFAANYPGYAGEIKEVLLRRDYYFFREQYLDLYMDLMRVDARIELSPIFFKQSSAIILEESFPELDRLFVTLAKSPGMHIRIEGHTDNIGKAEDLTRLSAERAESVKTFLVKKGIADFRITTVGLGPKSPINDNSSEELRSRNRRVECYITRL